MEKVDLAYDRYQPACLGNIIDELENMPQDWKLYVDNRSNWPTTFHSDRGYYEHLAFSTYQFDFKCYNKQSDGYHQVSPFRNVAESDFPSEDYEDDWTSMFHMVPDLSKPPTVKLMNAVLKSLLGCYMEGYKGGTYVIERGTPVWNAEWGECSNIGVCGLEYGNGEVFLETTYYEI